MKERIQAFWYFLGSLRATLLVLAITFILVLTATLLQSSLGVYKVQQLIFNSWYGGRLVVILFTVNMIASLIQRLGDIRRPLGIILAHIGIIVLLYGGFTTVFTDFFVLGIPEGSTADRVFHNDAWELLLLDDDGRPALRVPLQLGRGSRSLGREYHGKVLIGGSLVDFRLQADSLVVNADPDAENPGNYREAQWADSAASNLPLVTGTLELVGSSSVRFQVWSGNAGGETLPVSAGGQLQNITMLLQPRTENLPFTLRLDDFTAEFFPDSELPKSFSSDVTVIDDQAGTSFPARIEMNKPLRYRGFVFYQSSYQDGGLDRFGQPLPDASVFSVQRSRGGLLPYIGTGIIMLGFFLHYLTRSPRKRPTVPATSVAFLLGILLFAPSVVQAQSTAAESNLEVQNVPAENDQRTANIDAFSRLVVQSHGRIMPMESFAEAFVYEMSGKRRIRGYDSVEILYSAVFDLGSILDVEMIRVNNPGIFLAMGMGYQDSGRYSVEFFLPALENLARLYSGITGDVTDDPMLREIQSLYLRLNTLFRMAASFDYLNSEMDPRVYFDHPLRIAATEGEDLWFHPADGAEEILSADRVPQEWEMVIGSALASASSDLVPGLMALSEAQQAMLTSREQGAIQAELLYRHTHPIGTAILLLIPAALATGISLENSRMTRRRRRIAESVMRITAAVTSILAVMILTLGIGLRMYITGRPPVTNLYSSLIFAAWIIAAGALMAVPVLAFFRKRKGGDIPAATVPRWALYAASALMLYGASGFLPGSDDLAVVQAVLNSNFWLSVHVLVIIFGYAAVLYVAVLGHIQTGVILRNGRGAPSAASRYKTLLTALRISLLLLFIGTMLGGFWADQSWGRFWGWDPKENAALLLILWVAMVLHARPAGILSDFGVSLASAASLMVLVFSWFGVNLMATGLHSYGWDSRTGLLVFTVLLADAVFIVVSLIGYRSRRGLHPASHRRYRIQRLERIGENYVRVRLSPQLHSRGGQSITLRIESEGRQLIRAYSLSSRRNAEFIVQRREEGLAWEFFSQIAREGMTVRGTAPYGSFVLNGDRRTNRWIFAGTASGVSPLLSMIDELEPSAAVLLFIGGYAPDSDPYSEMLERLLQRMPNLKVIAYSGESAANSVTDEIAPVSRLVKGRFSLADIYAELDSDLAEEQLAEMYLCGGEAFVASMSADYEKLGDPAGYRLSWYKESFTATGRRVVRSDARYRILISGSDRVIDAAAGQTVYEAMEQAGISMKGNCLVGQCGECSCNLIRGKVEMDEPNILGKSSETRGTILTCNAYLKDDAEIEV